MDGLCTLLSVVLVIGPFVYAILILRKLDAAATKRKQLGAERGSGFMLVDLMSLILLVGIPLKILEADFVFGISVVLVLFSEFAMLMIWATTIRTVALAGVDTFLWRSLTSMVLIPTMYVGCFYVGIVSVNLIWGQRIDTVLMTWFALSVTGMIASPWIVRGAIRSASRADQTKAESKVVDPFGD